MNKFEKYFGKLKKKKASDIKVVVLCVIAATTFWVLNALNKDNYLTVVNYPISFEYNREEYMAVEKLPSNIKIEITGNGWDLFRKYFNVNVPPFSIELPNPDKQKYLLSSAYRRSLSEILEPTNLSAILTDTLKFNIDKIITKEFQIRLDTSTLNLAPHFQFADSIFVEPILVQAKGPESKIQALNDSLYIKIDENGLKESYDQVIPLEIPEELTPFIHLDPNSAQVKFDLIEFIEGNKRIPIQQKNFPNNVSIDSEIKSILLNYRVDERRVKDLQELELIGIIDYYHRNKDDSTVQIEIPNLPDYIESIVFEPNSFQLKYE
ncbi:YbbR-like domain-containing protein [Echinicola marina]|uniref:YbbR-like domain-containing protein n=1 Tax=Echinicola marina TaxID=2859768 RepID=UPI001CF651B4|nr:YbbR-like domain-containing protein [Echinicola marina]UCS95116.1 YbbR-like domain-containing protein [Echinicola marina]